MIASPFFSSAPDPQSLPDCHPPEGAMYGWPGCDTPYSMFYSMLDAAKRELPDPDYVFLTGMVDRIADPWFVLFVCSML